jgi:hypothetical protein
MEPVIFLYRIDTGEHLKTFRSLQDQFDSGFTTSFPTAIIEIDRVAPENQHLFPDILNYDLGRVNYPEGQTRFCVKPGAVLWDRMTDDPPWREATSEDILNG